MPLLTYPIIPLSISPINMPYHSMPDLKIQPIHNSMYTGKSVEDNTLHMSRWWGFTCRYILPLSPLKKYPLSDKYVPLIIMSPPLV